MDPVADQISAARDCGADRIELYTGPFAHTFAREGANAEATQAQYRRYANAAEHAFELGLGLNAGHDLDQANLVLFREVTGLAEVSIGHALISDALEDGLAPTVANYLAVLRG